MAADPTMIAALGVAGAIIAGFVGKQIGNRNKVTRGECASAQTQLLALFDSKLKIIDGKFDVVHVEIGYIKEGVGRIEKWIEKSVEREEKKGEGKC